MDVCHIIRGWPNERWKHIETERGYNYSTEKYFKPPYTCLICQMCLIPIPENACITTHSHERNPFWTTHSHVFCLATLKVYGRCVHQHSRNQKKKTMKRDFNQRETEIDQQISLKFEYIPFWIYPIYGNCMLSVIKQIFLVLLMINMNLSSSA